MCPVVSTWQFFLLTSDMCYFGQGTEESKQNYSNSMKKN